MVRLGWSQGRARTNLDMALQRQPSGNLHVGIPVSSSGDHEVLSTQRPSVGHSRMYDGVRSDRRSSNLNKPSRLSKGKRPPHSWRFLPCSVACVVAFCSFAFIASVFSSQFLMGKFFESPWFEIIAFCIFRMWIWSINHVELFFFVQVLDAPIRSTMSLTNRCILYTLSLSSSNVILSSEVNWAIIFLDFLGTPAMVKGRNGCEGQAANR